MLKRLGVVIPSTILTLLMAVGFSTPAFAFVDTTEAAEEPAQVVEEAEPTEEEKIPFTIAGNGEVEDNMMDDPSKEFFTVKTKGGNTFFLVIDRARNSENVYMLSMIDEYDYHAELLDYEEAHRKLNKRLTAIMEDTLVWERALSLRNPWIQQMAQYKTPEEFDRNFVKKYIERVTVTLLGDRRAEISLTMKTDEWKKMLDRIEMEGTDDGAKE